MVLAVYKPFVALNDRVGLNKMLVNLSPRKTRSVDMSRVNHRQSLIEQHRSCHRLLQKEIVQNELSQRLPIFHVRVHETC